MSTPTNRTRMSTSPLAQQGGNLAIPSGPFNQFKGVTMADNKENVGQRDQFGRFKDQSIGIGDGHKAQAAAAYTTTNWNNPSTLGNMVLPPKHASNFPRGHVYDGKTSMGVHMGYLGNNSQSSGSVALQPVLGVDSGMAGSTISPHMQFSGPFEAKDKYPLIGQNQSYCPSEAKTADHLSRMDLKNLMVWAIQHRILLTYSQYKKSRGITSNAPIAAFVNHMHSVACNHACKCGQFYALAVHYEACHDAGCHLCGPVWYCSVTNKPYPKFEEVRKRFVQRDSNYGVSHHSSYGRSETMPPFKKRLNEENSSCPSLSNGKFPLTTPLNVQPCYSKLPPLQQLPDPVHPSCRKSETMRPPSKRLKVGNASCPSFANGTFSAMTPLKVQPCYSKLPPLQQLPDPVSTNSEVMEVNMELLPKLIEDSKSAQEIGNNVADNFPISGPSEVVVWSYNKEGNMEAHLQLPDPACIDSEVMEASMESLPKLIEDSTSSKEIGDSVADNPPTSGPSEAVVCSFNKEGDMDFTTTNIEDNGIDYRNNLESSITSPGLSGGFAAGCEERETEAKTNSNQAELAIKNGLIAQELNCRKELASVCEEEVRANYNHAELAMDNELIAQKSNCGQEIKAESQKLRGVSLTENFTAQQLIEHISSLGQCIDQNMPKKERGKTIVNVDSENSCQLCGAVKLSLAPAPIYCSSCGTRIRRGATYYGTPEENDIRHCLCTSCFKVSTTKSIRSSGIALSKPKLDKRKNDEEVDESWVQCDKCQRWQHQICALFNDKKDMEGKAQFICPKCCLKEIQNGERIPPPTSTVFGAKDLPCTGLSDRIEQRIIRRLRKEREEKARVTGKSIDEVPEAEGLVVRVVSSVDKVVKVNKQLLDILPNENYPAEFPYKLKVILLFQKIEGVDVCLFSMYIQEFGSESGHPNQRCVYISYLDSVKYFRPETETTAAGEALRTVVYHEILIGYLEYCKKRGFATCYLWVCPPQKGEDYILYCHPEIQKTPKSDKLRQWYQSMLQKAIKEEVVIDTTNLYDQFFVSTERHNSKVTAAHLPYFDGDFWSGAAEGIIKDIEKDCSEDSKRTGKKVVSKRTLKAMGYTNPSGDATKDILLMQKLGEKILPNKDDFIIAHLHFVCTCCHRAILSGWRWSCSTCKVFQLCERCYDADKDCTHTLWNGEKHLLSKMLVDDVPCDTGDKDVCMDNSLFGNRHNFLSFCQKNNYQFDTLRRAKYSSMMLLHYLHNPTLLMSSGMTSCSICYKDTSIDQSWLCEMCPNFAVCASCYQRDGCSSHIHKLALHSSNTLNSETKINRSEAKQDSLRRHMLDALAHACECCSSSSSCTYPDCARIKKLFLHAKNCSVKAAGGCKHCKKVWLMLRLHAGSCKQSDCRVPRCRDIKQHARLSTEKAEAIAKG